MGLKDGYDGIQCKPWQAELIVQKYCDEIGFGVSIKPTRFIYTDGSEDGVEIGLINYPRFPKTVEDIKEHALTIASILMVKFNQHRCSIVFTDETVMLENENRQE
jgi:hypothetical protein